MLLFLLYAEVRVSISWESCLNGKQKGFGDRETQVTTQPSWAAGFMDFYKAVIANLSLVSGTITSLLFKEQGHDFRVKDTEHLSKQARWRSLVKIAAFCHCPCLALWMERSQGVIATAQMWSSGQLHDHGDSPSLSLDFLLREGLLHKDAAGVGGRGTWSCILRLALTLPHISLCGEVWHPLCGSIWDWVERKMVALNTTQCHSRMLPGGDGRRKSQFSGGQLLPQAVEGGRFK